MNKTELLETLSGLGIQPSRHLGQNFLVDTNLLQFIVRTASPKPSDIIIEIGPGLGVLTEQLVNSGAKVIAVEYDRRLASYLREKFKQADITLIEQDACKADFEAMTKDIGNYKVVSNLPYSISTPIAAILSELSNPPDEMTFLIQKETAERFSSSPGTKAYGSISVKLQASFTVKYIRTVPPDVFFPKPEVNSAIVQFYKKSCRPSAEEKKQLGRILHSAFLRRRKKLINNISGLFPDKDPTDIFSKLGLDTNSRPENLAPEQYLSLVKEVSRYM